jgi:hypothetical protein
LGHQFELRYFIDLDETQADLPHVMLTKKMGALKDLRLEFFNDETNAGSTVCKGIRGDFMDDILKNCTNLEKLRLAFIRAEDTVFTGQSIAANVSNIYFWKNYWWNMLSFVMVSSQKCSSYYQT